jgi:hypothetical protein
LLLAVLIAYALLGRAVAGLGVPPVYIGEVVLGMGLLTAVAAGWHLRLVRTPSIYLLIAFMSWGAVRTIPYLGTYGVDALRDSVIWGYGTFALLLAPLLVRRDLVDRIPHLYGRVLPWIVLCAPAVVLVAEWILGALHHHDVRSPYSHDAAVHLGGAAAFLLAGVRSRPASAAGVVGWLTKWGLSLALLAGVVAMGSLNRGGLLAVIAAVLVVMILQPFKAIARLLGFTAALLAIFWLGSGPSFQVRQDRAVGLDQIVRNLVSIGGRSGTEGLESTRRWRLLWWNDIVGYTLHGQYFWTGKGFGLNLADDDEFQVLAESALRSPHNGHLTILARAGVPGLVLWAALQLGFALGMLNGLFRARQAGQHRRASLFVWILAYWLAFLVNATFTVALEGPQAGIWFWCLFAYGIALIVAQSRQFPLQPGTRAPSAPRRVQTLRPSRAV